MTTIYSIALDNQKQIDFTLTRKKMRNIIIRVKADGTIAVSAPKQAALEEITRFILNKLDWINSTRHKLALVNDLNYLPTKVESGQSLIILGDSYYLQVINSEIQGVFLQDNKICIHSRQPENHALLESILSNWLVKYTRATFEQLLKMLHPRFSGLNLPFPKLLVRRLKSSWGLCRLREQSITLNSALIHTPLSCVEYVVLHELAHLKHFNHSKDFYTLLAQVCPDWKEQKTLLRKYSSVLRR